jgi:hypothetical protein
MSLRSRLAGIFSKAPAVPPESTSGVHPSRHERREAGRRRHHETGEPAWEASDRLEQPEHGRDDPDAAPEILGG